MITKISHKHKLPGLKVLGKIQLIPSRRFTVKLDKLKAKYNPQHAHG